MPPIGSGKMDDEAEPARWGTWEELVLGQAVVRHGSDAWDSVASEVQNRTTVSPHLFTPEECKARYKELLGRFGDREELLNELRKLRIKELRNEIEKSECSIGSLQTTLETLNAVKQEGDLDHNTRGLESLPLADNNMEGRESTEKERCMDGSSAGSFTECVISRDSSLVCQIPSTKLGEPEDDAVKVKLELPEDIKGVTQTLKKRRGMRKRKECIEMRDGGGGTGESDVLSSANTHCAKVSDELVVDHDKIKPPDRFIESVGQKLDHLPRILDFILEHKDAGVIRGQHESQRRVRYKKLIKRHIDLEMIKRRTEEKSYTTSLEMKRDLLLLLNNVIVYYSKGSPDHNSALTLRKLVTEKFWELCAKDVVSAMLLRSRASNPVKPRSSRLRKHESIVKADDATMQMGSVNGKVVPLRRKKSDEQFSFVKEKNAKSVERKKSEEEFCCIKDKTKDGSVERKKSVEEFSRVKEKKNDKSVERKKKSDEEFSVVKDRKNDKSVARKKCDEGFSVVKEKENDKSVSFAKNRFEDASFTAKAATAPFFQKKANEAAFTLAAKREMASIVRKKTTRVVSFIKGTGEDVLLKKKKSVQGVTRPSLPAKRPADRAGKKDDDEGGGKQLKSSSGKGRKR